MSWIPACVLVLRSQRTPDRAARGVLFVDASARFVAGKNQNDMGADDVAATVEAYRSGEDPDGVGGVERNWVPPAELSANGWDLNIARYIRPKPVDVTPLPEALTALRGAQAASKRAEVALEAALKELTDVA